MSCACAWRGLDTDYRTEADPAGNGDLARWTGTSQALGRGHANLNHVTLSPRWQKAAVAELTAERRPSSVHCEALSRCGLWLSLAEPAAENNCPEESPHAGEPNCCFCQTAGTSSLITV